MTGPDDGNLRKVVGLGLAIAGLLGIAVAGGSIVRATTTEATTSQALPYAAMGALAGATVAAILLLAIRSARTDWFRMRAPEVLAFVFIAAALGALVGSALTPRTPPISEVSPLDQDEIDRRTDQSGRFDENTRAGPVDIDGDGQPDTGLDGELLIGFDSDGDGRLDGYLQSCPPGTPVPEPRPGFTPIDHDCDGTVDQWLAFDPNQLLVGDGQLPQPPVTISPEQRQERADDAGAAGQRSTALRNVLLILLALAVATAIIVWLVRMPDRDADDDRLDEPDGGDAGSIGPPPVDLAPSFEASLDTMLDDPDPRTAICAAYGRLLDGFASAGLPRRPEEAPDEHARRCLAAARMDPRPVRELLDLFALARFSGHPIDETHRLAAVRAMRSALGSTPSVTGPQPVGASTGWNPPGGPT